MGRLRRIFLCCFLFVIVVCCTDRYKTVHEHYVMINTSDLKNDSLIFDSLSKSYYSRLNKPASFGRTFSYKLSKAQEGKKFYLVFYGKTRSNYAQSNATITIIGHTSQNEQICWLSIFLRRHYTDQNKWCYFRDSIRIEPTYLGKTISTITCVPYLAGSNTEEFDLDTLLVTIKEKL